MKRWHLLPGIIFIVLVVFFGRGLKLEPHKLPSVHVGKPMPVFDLPKLNLGPDEIAEPTKEDQHNNDQVNFKSKSESERFTPNLLKGRIALLNVWSSWCSACEAEQEFLIQLSKKGVPIFGLNYKDNPEDAISWIQRWGNPYQAIGLDQEGSFSIDLGVYGTPETFLIDSEGIILLRHPGILDLNVWNKIFLPLIHRLEKG